MPMSERPAPAPRPRPWIGWTLVALAVGASVCILGAAVRVRMRVAAHAEPLPVAATPDPAPPVGASGVAPAAAEAEARDTVGHDGNAAPRAPNTGELRLPAVTKSHRIFVDGRPAVEGGRLRLACGEHSVRVGSTTRTVLVPCGGSVTPTL
jgi:hypothetical protein